MFIRCYMVTIGQTNYLRNARSAAIARSIKYFFILVLSITYGCSTAPERVTFADIAANNAPLLTSAERITLDIEADCEAGLCELPESNLETVMRLITLLQDEIDRRVMSHNSVVQALNHLQFAYSIQENTLHMTEKAHRRDSIISGVKQALTTGALIFCAVQ
jgi:two-component sensor histidine kinase